MAILQKKPPLFKEMARKIYSFFTSTTHPMTSSHRMSFFTRIIHELFYYEVEMPERETERWAPSSR